MNYRIKIDDVELRTILKELRNVIDPLPGTIKLIERLEMVSIRSRSIKGRGGLFK